MDKTITQPSTVPAQDKGGAATAQSSKKDHQPLAVVQEKTGCCPTLTNQQTVAEKPTAPVPNTDKKIQQPQVAPAAKISSGMGLDTEMSKQLATTGLENINACQNKSCSIDSQKQVPELEKTGRRSAAVPYLEKTGVRSSPRLAKRVRSNDDQVHAYYVMALCSCLSFTFCSASNSNSAAVRTVKPATPGAESGEKRALHRVRYSCKGCISC